MKKAILSFTTILFCFVICLGTEAQQHEKQRLLRQKTNQPQQSKQKPTANDPISGSWEGVVHVQVGTETFDLIIRLNGEKVSGVIGPADSRLPIEIGNWDGNTLTLTYKLDDSLVTMTAILNDGKLVGNYELSGSNNKMQGKWEAKRKNDPAPQSQKEASQSKQQQPRPSQSSLATNNTQDAAEEFIKKYFANSDQWAQHSEYLGAHKPSPLTPIANEAVKVMEREGVSAVEFFASLFKFFNDANLFWKDGEARDEVISDYAKRVPLVPASVYREWTEALGKASGSYKLQMIYNLGTIILQDQLFTPIGFKEEEAKRFISRLRSTPYEATQRWADMHSIQTYQAAFSLINIESLFSKDVFQQEAFAKLVKK